MASKPFFSMDEVCARLGKTADEVKALVRDGQLREFRDAGKIFFKADDINKLAGEAAPPDAGGTGVDDILLEPVDEPAAGETDEAVPDLGDSDTSGGTSIIGLEPLDDEEEESGDDKKEDTVVTTSGIGVFDDDELEITADPMAETQITTGATGDQVTLEGAGSGSGLLDLAREADDTALGADLLDEIYPGEEDVAPPDEAAVATAEPEAEAEAEEAEEEAVLEEAGAGEVLVPITAVTTDPAEGLFSGLLVGAVILMGLAASVVAGAVQGYLPDYGRFLSDGKNFYFFLGGAVLLSVITLLAGWFIGKAFAPRRR